MARRWLVTGCSSGLGYALAEAVARGGDTVLATTRRPGALEPLAKAHPGRITEAVLDVRDAGQCRAAVELAVERLGGVDVLVNNAGCGLFGAVEEVSDAELREQLEVLVVGPWRLTREVLPLMRAQGSGHIVNVSSLAGRTVFPGLGAYSAGKYALEAMSQALAVEAAAFGVRVTVLEPGGFATRYGSSLTAAAARMPEYEPATDPMLDGLRAMEGNAELGRPEDFAALVRRVVASGSAPLRLPVGEDAFGYLTTLAAAAVAELAEAADFVGDPGAAQTAPVPTVPAPARAEAAGNPA
ncbi:SDR family oxidoreductase [Kitasatospora sp. NPDC057015]|uniref:SDR family oxidoreductase n=1 Tax=Kitasatospora sp. NPDC057015 TaxID=3346001 RepID=UPI0036445ED2